MVQLPFPSLYEVLRERMKSSTRLYLVGGCVRDLLLGALPHDIDLVVSDQAKELGRAAANVFHGAFYPLDAERETYRLLLNDEEGREWKVDLAKFRGDDLADDLSARDFTINAMALEVSGSHEPVLIDPMGGKADLLNGRLRLCSERAFLNDPVRILRATRIQHQFGLIPTPDVSIKMQEAMPGLASISGERLRDEFFRLFDLRQPVDAMAELAKRGFFHSVELLADPSVDDYPVSKALVQIFKWMSDGDDPAQGWLGDLPSFFIRVHSNLTRYLAESVTDRRSRKALMLLASWALDSSRGSEETAGEVLSGYAKRFALSLRERAVLTRFNSIFRWRNRLSRSAKPLDRKTIYHFFRDYENDGAAVCLLLLALELSATKKQTEKAPAERFGCLLEACRDLLEAYWLKPEESVSPLPYVSGDDLQAIFTLEPGPAIGEILAGLREAQAAGEISSRDEAIAFAEAQLRATKRG